MSCRAFPFSTITHLAPDVDLVVEVNSHMDSSVARREDIRAVEVSNLRNCRPPNAMIGAERGCSLSKEGENHLSAVEIKKHPLSAGDNCCHAGGQILNDIIAQRLGVAPPACEMHEVHLQLFCQIVSEKNSIR